MWPGTGPRPTRSPLQRPGSGTRPKAETRCGDNATGESGLARLLEHEIGQRSADQIAGHPSEERNRTKDAERLQGDVPVFAQVSRIPGQIKIGPKEETAISERDEPHVRRAEDAFPGHGLLRSG